MRAREVLREAIRDIASGAGAAFALSIALAVAAGGPAVGAAVSAARTVAQAHAYVAAGAATYVMAADGRIDGPACDALRDLRQVRASGALREADAQLRMSSQPQTPIELFDATAGFPAVLGVDSAAPGVLLATEVSASLGARTGDAVQTDRGATPVAGVYAYPDDGRDPGLSFAAIARVPADERPFDACWALIWPADEQAVAALGRTVLATSSEAGARPVLRQLNPTRGAAFDTRPAFGRAPATALAAALSALVGALSVVRRRLILASDRHVGVGRTAQLASHLLQVVCWTSVGAVAALGATLLVLPVDDADRLPLLQLGVMIIGAGTASAFAAAAVALGLVRERALYCYFKNR